jgi:regulator of protease activity HflC (stomatin/prohibitin superfamily)
MDGPEFVGGRGGGIKMPSPPRFSGKLQGLITLSLVLVFIVLVLYAMFLDYVRPYEYGIKEVRIGVNKGIQEQVFEPGFVMVIPYMQRLHRLPAQTQVLELTQAAGNTNTAARATTVHYDQPAKIQTSDGFYVDVDVSILYRIADAYKVVTKLGPGEQYFYQGLLPKAEPILKDALGVLTTEEFYNSPLRVERVNEAKDQLNEALDPIGLHVDEVLVRYFKYSDAIQENIEEKKLQDQLVFTNQSKRKAAEQEQSLNRITTQGEMQVKITIEEGDAYKIRREAERDLYVRKQEAEADLLVELAEAQRTELKNEALQVLGADKKVALEMAEVLSGLEAIVVPTGGVDSFNPLALDASLEMFGVQGFMEETGKDPKTVKSFLPDIKVPEPPSGPIAPDTELSLPGETLPSEGAAEETAEATEEAAQ